MVNNVASTLCNIENSTSDFVSFSTSDQRYFNVDPQLWNNVDVTLKYLLGTSIISYYGPPDIVNTTKICFNVSICTDNQNKVEKKCLERHP